MNTATRGVPAEDRVHLVAATWDHGPVAFLEAVDRLARHAFGLHVEPVGQALDDPAELRLDRPRAERGGRHAGAVEVERQALRERQHERLRRRVRRLPRYGHEPGDRRHIQDPPAAALHHPRHERAAQRHHRFHVEPDHLDLRADRQLLEVPDGPHARVVDEHVHDLVARGDLVRDPVAIGGVGEVGGDPLDADAVLAGDLRPPSRAGGRRGAPPA